MINGRCVPRNISVKRTSLPCALQARCRLQAIGKCQPDGMLAMQLVCIKLDEKSASCLRTTTAKPSVSCSCDPTPVEEIGHCNADGFTVKKVYTRKMEKGKCQRVVKSVKKILCKCGNVKTTKACGLKGE
ncbi:unnamed protein product [Protopolystoma xenopodis]|uniref:Uncharacterized protein n=1 Tax=Protopolystoma xenopodis TaxID=117903 RepID=A0A3S5AWW0_9PLAT|nr:unnamed protein product [Protopolystoma xenopodis]